ncbi:MAG TPA: DUF72 domain-containing protein [Actinomycetota bacterium]|nr:DUF72 domain-containing protein [Actinomycetota bacterium]
MTAPRGTVLVGISSWTEPTLVKETDFYPKEARTAEARLRYYASRFPIVEVDSTYYAPPSERNAALWAERTPPHFTFDVKAYSLLTHHPTRVDSLHREVREALPRAVAEKRRVYLEHLPPALVDEVWERFREALMPLHSAGKLGGVLFQFPQWFVIGRRNREYIVECAERLRDFRVAVEFRHRSWMEERNREETLSFLEEHGIPYVCVDMPQGFDSSVPPVAAATSRDLAVVRFHGRDPEAWASTSGTAADRFRYDYRREELEEWVPRIRALSEQARETHVIMNNCYRDYAVRSASTLAALLSE